MRYSNFQKSSLKIPVSAVRFCPSAPYLKIGYPVKTGYPFFVVEY
ncbi:hypothetical protein D1AOALGA4SA_9584 [Olavius algarvensis Delta 1 endosymbiont]|nr:hypothetical protein D1AOALGA4SA_9584 [Olavius algarvensis Delta 1 endosymbiont]